MYLQELWSFCGYYNTTTTITSVLYCLYEMHLRGTFVAGRTKALPSVSSLLSQNADFRMLCMWLTSALMCGARESFAHGSSGSTIDMMFSGEGKKQHRCWLWMEFEAANVEGTGKARRFEAIRHAGLRVCIPAIFNSQQHNKYYMIGWTHLRLNRIQQIARVDNTEAVVSRDSRSIGENTGKIVVLPCLSTPPWKICTACVQIFVCLAPKASHAFPSILVASLEGVHGRRCAYLYLKGDVFLYFRRYWT